MDSKRYMGLAALCLVLAVLAGVTAGLGAFARGDGSLASDTSLRGERFSYATTGVYAYNAERVVAEGVGWDYLTLFFAVPALLLAVPGVYRGTVRARLFALGILAYLFYQYLMYAVFWAFGPLFVPFILLYSGSAAAIVWSVTTLDVRSLPQRFTARFPRKTIAMISGVMALQLVAMWSKRIAVAYSGDFAGAGFEGTPTLAVQALDLGIIVPLALATAALLWRRSPWGYLLGSVFAVKGVTMAGAICAMLISAAIVEGSLQVPELAIFGTATALFGFAAVKTFMSIAAERSAGIHTTDVTPVGA